MENILLLTDLTDSNEHVYRYALKLAAELNTGLVLLHVTQETGERYTELSDGMEKLKERLLQTVVRKKEGELNIHGVIETGVFPSGIRKVIDRFKVGLLLMGAADGNNETGFLFGNKVRSVVEGIKFPILFIPEQATFKDIKHIIYVTDIRYSDYKIIERLVEMVLPMHIEVSLLHVCAEGLPEIDTETVVSLFTDTVLSNIKHPLNLYKSSKANMAEITISQLLDHQSQTILAFPHRKHHFFNHLFSDKPVKEANVYKRMPFLLMPVG